MRNESLLRQRGVDPDLWFTLHKSLELHQLHQHE